MTPGDQIRSEIRAELIARISQYDNEIDRLKAAAGRMKELEALKAAAELELAKYPELAKAVE